MGALPREAVAEGNRRRGAAVVEGTALGRGPCGWCDRLAEEEEIGARAHLRRRRGAAAVEGTGLGRDPCGWCDRLGEAEETGVGVVVPAAAGTLLLLSDHDGGGGGGGPFALILSTVVCLIEN